MDDIPKLARDTRNMQAMRGKSNRSKHNFDRILIALEQL